MIVYVDASALVKRYVEEPGSEAVIQMMAQARALGTAAITRVEVVSALARAAHRRILSKAEASKAQEVFLQEWPSLVRIQVTEGLLARAGDVAWRLRLRGYDAVHLAAALLWQDLLNEPVVMATYDQELWRASKSEGLEVFPDEF